MDLSSRRFEAPSQIIANTVYPADHFTPPKDERFLQVRESHQQLAAAALDLTFSKEEAINGARIIGLGALCTMPAIEQLNSISKVDREGVLETYNEFCSLGDYYKETRNTIGGTFSQNAKGYWAEVAVTKTIWGAIAEGFIEDGHAILLGEAGKVNNQKPGLKNDIDIRATIDGQRYKFQVKLSRNKVHRIYADGIDLISPQQFVRKKHIGNSIDYLMGLHNKDQEARSKVYLNLRNTLKNLKSKPTSIR